MIAALGAATIIWQLQTPGPLPADRALIVPRGSITEVAESLRRQGAIKQTWPLLLAGFATHWLGPMRAGELLFPAHANLEQVLLILRTGRQVEHSLTIPEGLTSAQAALLIARAPGITGEITVPAEGSILPQTYHYLYDTPADSILARLRAAMTTALNAAWHGRAAGLALKSPQELLVLASLVERETAIPAERALIARVFLNRLKFGMKLQSDPTVIYPASGGLGTLPAPLTKEALQTAWPYNLYMFEGLPPGPICNPGLAAIRAAAHPAESDALYFVADGTGGHAFSTTLAEHNRNVAKYREIKK